MSMKTVIVGQLHSMLVPSCWTPTMVGQVRRVMHSQLRDLLAGMVCQLVTQCTGSIGRKKTGSVRFFNDALKTLSLKEVRRTFTLTGLLTKGDSIPLCSLS